MSTDESNPWGIHCGDCTISHPCDSCQEQLDAEWAHWLERHPEEAT